MRLKNLSGNLLNSYKLLEQGSTSGEFNLFLFLQIAFVFVFWKVT